MLSRADLNRELLAAIKTFVPTWENQTLITTTADYLDELVRILPNTLPDADAPAPVNAAPADPNSAEAQSRIIAAKTELLRKRLRNILEVENRRIIAKELCDKAFNLQITLARALPVNTPSEDVDPPTWQDPITLADLDLNSPLIFLSNGHVVSKESAQTWFKDLKGDNRIIDNNPLSARELASLQSQGIAFPSFLERNGRKIGKFFGETIGWAAMFSLGFFCSAGLMLSASAWGLMVGLCSPEEGFKKGLNTFVACVVVGTVLSLVFPPIAIAIGGTAAGIAASAAFYLALTVALPPLMIAIGIVVSKVRQIPYVEVMKAIAQAPVNLSKFTLGFIGETIGKCLAAIGRFLHLLPPPIPAVPFPQVQQRQNEVVIDVAEEAGPAPAPVVNSHAVIANSLGIAPSLPVPALQQSEVDHSSSSIQSNPSSPVIEAQVIENDNEELYDGRAILCSIM